MRIAFYTLGCKVNQYDTQMMIELLEQQGHVTVPFQEVADCYIINTCTVTNMSDKKSRQILSRCKKINPDAIVIVCGCYSQISPEETSKIKGVDIVIGTANRKNICTYLDNYLKERKQIIAPADLNIERLLCGEKITQFEEKTRAIIKIEDGCRNFCSYCAIPFARGHIRSKKMNEIAEELIELRKNKYNEVVLTGIHLASYGKDLENVDLADAIKLTASHGFNRIRLGSLEPNIITENFLTRIYPIKQLMPSFHLSLQSGCDTVLKRMNRHYTTQDYKIAVDLLRNYYPNCAITTDIIVGFPGENEDEFDQTVKFVEEISFAKIHIFPYSPRKGTKAAQMKEQIPGNIKTQRCKILEKVEQASRSAFAQTFVGQTVTVLVEQQKGEFWEGYTENYLPVHIQSDEDLTGKIVTVKISHTDGNTLYSKGDTYGQS